MDDSIEILKEMLACANSGGTYLIACGTGPGMQYVSTDPGFRAIPHHVFAAQGWL